MIQLYNEDCLEGMKRIPDKSVDMVLTDLPYNITACTWDKDGIDVSVMWREIKRILKPQCSAVMFASSHFTNRLIASNEAMYKYKWIWVKNAPTMFIHAKNAPMRKFEEILVFSDGSINHASCSKRRMKYNPQGVVKTHLKVGARGKRTPSQLHDGGLGDFWRQAEKNGYYYREATNYPCDVLCFDVVPTGKKVHPTQKPTKLLEYLIKTYTDKGETVMDITMGSGSTGVACVNTNRNFIGFELDKKFYVIAEKRIEEALIEQEQNLFSRIEEWVG